MSDLKPCPCCNSKKNLYSRTLLFSPPSIGCESCGIEMPESIWNNRPAEAALQKRVEELEANNAKAWNRVQYLQDHISMIRTDCLNGRFNDIDQVSHELFLAYQGEREAQ